MVTTAPEYHVPVLLTESVDGLDIQASGIYIDVTFGGGGHSREILKRLGQGGHLFSFDQDADAEQNVGDDLAGDKRWTFVRSNFRYLKNWMRYYGIHFDDETRGFSFRFNDSPLDMRMNKRAGKTAADVLNNSTEEQLADIFYLYGELKNARRIAAAIVKSRTTHPMLNTSDFLNTVQPLFPREREKKETAKLFQALRIEVNQEMAALKEMLAAATELLRPGGRLSVITYHSLEDRIVKNMMKAGNAEGNQQKDFYGRVESPLTAVGKVIIPTAEEQASNPRSRSAKLRIAEKR